MRTVILIAGLVAGAVTSAMPSALPAQGRLAGVPESGLGPVFELWRFSGDGIPQPTVNGAGSVLVTRATQMSLPFGVMMPVGDRWTFDLSGAYARGEVRLSGVDPATGSDGYSLNGLTDLRLRATGRLVGDNVLVTAGVNLPTGATELDEEELSALRVLASPALSFQVPVLGIGGSGTLGVVLARQIGAWAWAFGASYEMRNKYTPVSVAAGLPVELSPGDAFRVSLGTDRLIGQNSMTIGLSADFYTRDRVQTGTGVGAGTAESQLGPIFTADLQYHAVTSRFRELTFYVVERYRSQYKRDGRNVAGSDANYLDAGVQAVAGVTPMTGILFAFNARHQTGLSSDQSLTTAAIASGALTVGVVQQLGSNYSLQPFVRVQGGRLESGDASSTATGFSGGLTFRVRL